MLIGLIVILIGALLLGQVLFPEFSINFGIVWSIAIIVVAIAMMIKRRKLDMFSSIVAFVGIWFLGRTTDLIPDNYGSAFWAIVLIIVGLFLVCDAIRVKKVNKKVHTKADASYYGVFSGQTEKVRTDDFKGATVYSIFGGVDLDLREADIAAESIAINVYSIFGGSNILVPDNVNIVMNSSAIFGDNENKANNKKSSNKKTIYINCVSVFGGTEVK